MQVNSDNLYKHLKYNSATEGLVKREYANEYVRLLCSTKEIDFTKDPDASDDNVKWDCTFITSRGAEEALLSWDAMFVAFERSTLNGKNQQSEIAFGNGE